MGGLGDLPDDVLKQVLVKLSVEMLVCVHRWQWERCENCEKEHMCVVPGLSKDLARIAASDELWRVIVGMRYASELALQRCTCGQHHGRGLPRKYKSVKEPPCPVTYNGVLKLLSDVLPGKPELGVTSWKDVYARLPAAFPTILDRVDPRESWQVDQSTGVVTWKANPFSSLGADRAICSSVPFDLSWAGAPYTLCLRPTTVNGKTKYAVAWTNVYYFEVTVLGPLNALAPDENVLPCICVGLEWNRGELDQLRKQPGWNSTSFGIHSDDGGIFHNNDAVKYNETKFGVGDTIGCGVRLPRDQPRELGLEIFFTKNGKYICMGFPRENGTHLETVSRDITRLYPIVGLDAHEISFAANFGRTPFRYDLSKIDADIRREETAFRSEFRGPW